MITDRLMDIAQEIREYLNSKESIGTPTAIRTRLEKAVRDIRLEHIGGRVKPHERDIALSQIQTRAKSKSRPER